MIQPTTIETIDKENKEIGICFSPFSQNSVTNYPVNLNTKEFEDTINYLCDNYEFNEIIETGTFDGLGSTTVFAKTNKYVFTVECNDRKVAIAKNNLRAYQNVCVVHGLSLKRESIILEIIKENLDIPSNKYDSDFPKTFYMSEIVQNVLLENFLHLFANNTNKQLLFLDSAGGIGYLEFKELMNMPYKENKIVVLDDIDHIKHKRSVEDLEKLGYTVNKSSDNRFAWCDLSKGKLKNEKNILSK